LVEVSTCACIATKPQNGNGKYKCKYCNEASKFQLVKVGINVGIARLNEESTFNVIPTCMVVSK
jgi:hypothetical protein